MEGLLYFCILHLFRHCQSHIELSERINPSPGTGIAAGHTQSKAKQRFSRAKKAKAQGSAKVSPPVDNLHFRLDIPDIFLIGGQKCGSTSLHTLLLEHSEICKTTVKEIHYFDGKHWNEGSHWYQETIKEIARDCTPSQLVIDSTPAYIRLKDVPAHFNLTYSIEELARKKFILILREPVSREISWYKHSKRDCVRHMQWAIERNVTRHARIQSDSIHAYNSSGHKFELVHHRKDLCFNSSKPSFCGKVGCASIPVARVDLLQDPIKSLYSFDKYYLSGEMEHHASFYLEQIQRWLGVIRREQLFIIHMDSLVKNTTEVMRTLSGFLGLKSDWGENVTLPHENESPIPFSISCEVMRELEGIFREANRGLEEFINSQHAPYEPHFPPLVLNESICVSS